MGLRYARALKPDRVRTDFSSVCDVVTRVPVFGVSLTDDWHHVNDAVKEVLQRTVGSVTDSG
jgi:hypothetical protein